MVAVAWTAIALMGTTLALLVGTLFRLSSKIETQGSELRVAIDAQGSELRAAFDGQGRDLGTRIDALTARVDALNARMDVHLERHAS
jgi:ABC-type transporter Mla subunit MlaD